MEERTGSGDYYPGRPLLSTGAGRDGFPDPDEFNKYHADRWLPKSDRGAGHIVSDSSSNRQAGTELPNWYHKGVIAVFILGIITLWITQMLWG